MCRDAVEKGCCTWDATADASVSGEMWWESGWCKGPRWIHSRFHCPPMMLSVSGMLTQMSCPFPLTPPQVPRCSPMETWPKHEKGCTHSCWRGAARSLVKCKNKCHAKAAKSTNADSFPMQCCLKTQNVVLMWKMFPGQTEPTKQSVLKSKISSFLFFFLF